VVWDDERILERQAEGIAAEQMPSIGADEVVRLGIADIEAGPVEDEARAVGAGTFHRLTDGTAQECRQRNRIAADARGLREFHDGQGFELDLGDLAAESILDEAGLVVARRDENILVLPAGLDGARQILVRDEHGKRFAFRGLFEPHGGEGVEVGRSERDPAFRGAFDFDRLEHGQAVGFLDEFAEAGERGLQFGHRECDGVHVVLFSFRGLGRRSSPHIGEDVRAVRSGFGVMLMRGSTPESR